MPEPPLPEDLKRWPQDPYALLGVRPGTPAKDVRKAYTRLIRYYKPEQYPEHFRRIRDAFETIQRFGEWLGPVQFDGEPIPPPIADPIPDEREPPDQPADLDFPNLEINDDPLPSFSWPGGNPAPRTGAEDDELAQLWERACRGEAQEAYLAMRRLVDRPGNPSEVCLRLYWLARIAPEVDPQQPPCHWLAQGLRCGGWHGPCRDLYQREIQRCPSEALSERFAGLLQTEAPLSVLAEWLDWRWRAAAGLQRWYVITADVEAMRTRFTADLDDEPWARLLLSAIDHVAWAPDAEIEKATQEYGSEIEKLTHLHGRLDLHRLDILREMSRSWKELHRGKNLLSALLDLIPRSWTQSPFELRQPLQAGLKDLLHKPDKMLAAFDFLKTRGPLVLAQLANLIDGAAYELYYRNPTLATPHDLEQTAAAFLDLVRSEHIPPREDFFQFCLREFVLPEEALRVMEGIRGCPMGIALLHEDVPIRLVCVAYRWFWG